MAGDPKAYEECELSTDGRVYCHEKAQEIWRLRAENARLTADLSKLRDDLETLIQQRDEAQRRRGEIEAECEALRADVVWAVRGYIRPIDDGQRLAIGIDPQTLFTRMVEWDGTDADILRAVREARVG